MAVTAETVATYRAAKAFLLSAWIGALLLFASFTQLYLAAALGSNRQQAWSLGLGIVMAALGGWMSWSSNRYYNRLDFPWRRRWMVGAILTAGSGGLFWLLFLLLQTLQFFGVKVLPQ